jgi:hypothetical protein
MSKASDRTVFEDHAMPFTEARIEQARRLVADGELPADRTGRRSWRDSSCRGLVLTVNQRTGSAVLYFQGTVNGRTVRRAIGDVETTRLDEARSAIGRLRYDRSAAGALAPRPTEPVEAESPTVGSVAAEMLAAHEAGRWLPGTRSRVPTDRTMKFYRDLRRARLTKHEGLTLAEFAAALPAVYAKAKAEAPIQANRFLQLVRNVYAYAADAGVWTASNPAAGTSKTDRLTRTAERARTRTLTDAEWRRLEKAMAADVPVWRDLFTMSLVTLQRIGACRHMRWADLSLTGKDAAWRIPAQWMKGRKAGHVVPLAELPEALAILRARRKAVAKDCPWVFPGPDGEPIRNHDKGWDRLIRAAGLWHEEAERRPRPHDLRRTGGARMTAAGVPLQTVTRALGDAPSSAAMVARTYAQVSDDALRDAFAAAAGRRRRR